MSRLDTSALSIGYTRPCDSVSVPSFQPSAVPWCRPAQGATATQFDQQARELLADNILDWDLTDPASNPIAVSREAIDRLQPELFLKLYRVVFGYDPSEVDPQWPSEQQDALAAETREAESAGKTIGELREERDEKN